MISVLRSGYNTLLNSKAHSKGIFKVFNVVIDLIMGFPVKTVNGGNSITDQLKKVDNLNK